MLVRPNEPLTLPPGPTQTNGSCRLVVGAGVNVVTVTVKEHAVVSWSASLTVQVTVVVPIGNVAPETGLQVGEPTPGQLSLTVGAA